MIFSRLILFRFVDLWIASVSIYQIFWTLYHEINSKKTFFIINGIFEILETNTALHEAHHQTSIPVWDNNYLFKSGRKFEFTFIRGKKTTKKITKMKEEEEEKLTEIAEFHHGKRHCLLVMINLHADLRRTKNSRFRGKKFWAHSCAATRSESLFQLKDDARRRRRTHNRGLTNFKKARHHRAAQWFTNQCFIKKKPVRLS